MLQHRLNRDGKKETIGAFLLCTEYRCMQAYLCVLCTSLSRDHPGCLAWLQAPYLTTNSPTWSKTQRRTPTTRNRKLPPQSHSCPTIIRTDVPLCPFSLTGRNMEGESPTSKRKSPVLEINTILPSTENFLLDPAAIRVTEWWKGRVRARRVQISLGARGCNEEEFSPSWLSHHEGKDASNWSPSALQLNTDRR